MRVLILGAAGRDFHDFNLAFRDRADHEVVAFTAAQIPGIAGRTYPAALAGPLYPRGVPIRPESEMEALIVERGIDEVVLSYSDLSHEEVMHKASRALAAGAGFRLLGPRETTLPVEVPVVSVCAVRTGAGKSPVARRVAALLRAEGLSVAIVRHPMPYGDLVRQAAQRFSSLADLDREGCTIEEREEYEPHLERGFPVFAGVDTARVLERARAEADAIVWDGGNNDVPFVTSDLEIVCVDPHRPGHETRYHPGETNLRRADVVVVTKVDTAGEQAVERTCESVRAVNARATIVRVAMPVVLEDAAAVRGRRVLVVEDGPTLTHGGMSHGAGWIAAQAAGAVVVDPRPFAVGGLASTYREHADLGPVLPAVGYGDVQIRELERTIAAADVDAVVTGTPIDLRAALRVDVPVVRARYDAADVGTPTLAEAMSGLLRSVAVRA